MAKKINELMNQPNQYRKRGLHNARILFQKKRKTVRNRKIRIQHASKSKSEDLKF